MSIWSALNSAYSFEDAFRAKDCTSQAMRAAVKEWFRLYYQQEPTEESDPCQRIAYTVVNKLTKTAFGEYDAKSDDEFAQSVLHVLDAVKKKAMQAALIGGEAWLKPVPGRDGFTFSVVSRDNVLIFGRDSQGVQTDVGAAEYSVNGRNFYTLLERRTVDRRGYLTIRNMLYCSEMPETLGRQVPLAELEQYEDLPEEYTFREPLGGLGMARMITPMENCVDGSKDGVSIYAPAVGLIHNIDRNEALLNGEFERGQSRIIVSDDLLRKDRTGRRRLEDKIFVGGFDENPEDMKPIIFSPELREKSFLARKQEYLRDVESIIGLKRGLLSEVEAEERTATEITSSAGDYNLTIIDFQSMFEDAVREAVRLCGVLGRLYRVPGAHDVNPDKVSIDWGDGVLYNRDKVNQEMLSQVQSGLLAPERYLGWYYEQPANTPEERARIRKDYMPELKGLAAEDDL
ncbi:MAG: hypothetical protein HDT14_05390 [Oscillibacter sp.]|nr:hypothetical protein [Oscillibacter sp.]